MATEFKDTIRPQMQGKNTQELIEILEKNDRTEWSEEAFDVIREIILERTGELPVQKLVTDAEPAEQDISYSVQRLTRAAFWASILSWVFLGFGVFITALNLWGVLAQDLTRYGNNILAIVFALASQLVVALAGAFFFVLLQVIAEGVYVLIDIEENTRMSAQRRTGQA